MMQPRCAVCDGDNDVMTLCDAHAALAFRAYRQSRDPEQLAALMAAYDGLARSIARRYHINDAMWSHEDLEQVAREGLLNAINRYDPDSLHRGRTFPTVAQFAIRHQIRRATGLDIAPDNAPDIADEDTIPLRIVTPLAAPAWMQDRTTRELPALDRTLELLAEVADPGPSVEEIVAASLDGVQVSARLEAALVLLSARERAIITHRYDLDGRGVWTVRTLAVHLGIDKSNVSRGERRALAKLHAELAASDDGLLALRNLHARAQQPRRRASRAA